MVKLGSAAGLIILLAVIGLASAAISGANEDFLDDIAEDACNSTQSYNSTSNQCYPSSGWGTTDNTTTRQTTIAWNVSQRGLESSDNATTYLDNIGTFLGIGMMLLIILGIGAYFKSRQQ